MGQPTLTGDPASMHDAERAALVNDVLASITEVYGGATRMEAEALIDQLSDRGLTVVRT